MQVNKRKITLALALSLSICMSSLARASTDNVLMIVNGSQTIQIKNEAGEVINGSWKSDNNKVCTVDSDGTITGVGLGTSIVHFKGDDGTTKDINVNIIRNKLKNKNVSYIVRDSEVEYTEQVVQETEAPIIDENHITVAEWDAELLENNSSSEDEDETIIEPGVYIVKAIGNDARCTVESADALLGVKYNSNINVGSNAIIEVASKDKVNTYNCELLDLYEPLNTTGSGEYIVGMHVPAGSYIVETDNSERGAVEIYTGCNKENAVYTEIVTQDSPVVINLADGQLVSLIDCKLT